MKYKISNKAIIGLSCFALAFIATAATDIKTTLTVDDEPVVTQNQLDSTYVYAGSDNGYLYTNNPVRFGDFKNYDVLADGQILNDKMVDFSINQEDMTIISPAVVFDGVGDYVEANQIALTGSENLDISFWMKVDNPGDGFIVNSYGISRSFIVRYLPGGNLRLSVSADGSVPPSLDTAGAGLNDNTWHYIHAYKHDTELGISIDGDALVTTNVTAGLNTGNASLRIGVSDTDTLYFSGQLADVTVSSDFESVRFPFTECAGTTAYDVSGNGNHGTASLSSSEEEFWNGTQTNSPYFAEYGGVTFTNGTGSNTIYVANIIDTTTPATNAVAGYAVSVTNSVPLAHNGGPFTLSNSVVGAVTYADLVTNTVWTTTTTNGLIKTFYK